MGVLGGNGGSGWACEVLEGEQKGSTGLRAHRAVGLVVAFDEETRAVPHHHPLQVGRHGAAEGGSSFYCGSRLRCGLRGLQQSERSYETYGAKRDLSANAGSVR